VIETVTYISIVRNNKSLLIISNPLSYLPYSSVEY